jgi:DNA-binding NarL/FixJ family response regulator
MKLHCREQPSRWVTVVFSAEIPRIKLVVVDPQSLLREALSALLHGAEGIDVVEVVGAAPELISCAQQDARWTSCYFGSIPRHQNRLRSCKSCRALSNTAA